MTLEFPEIVDFNDDEIVGKLKATIKKALAKSSPMNFVIFPKRNEVGCFMDFVTPKEIPECLWNKEAPVIDDWRRETKNSAMELLPESWNELSDFLRERILDICMADGTDNTGQFMSTPSPRGGRAVLITSSRLLIVLHSGTIDDLS